MSHFQSALFVLMVLPLAVLAQSCTSCGDSGACCTVLMVLPLVVLAQSCTSCGDNGACCTDSEECVKTDNGGTCHNLSDKVYCRSDGIFSYYCFKPQTCCLIEGCCPAGYSCCDFARKCCPKGTTCCRGGDYCCGGSNRSSPVSWTLPFVLVAVSRMAVGGLSGHKQ